MAKVMINDLDAAATLDGTELVELEQDGGSVKCTTQDIADLGGGGASYLKYVALLNQTGSAAPVATVLENTLGGAVVWDTEGDGVFSATLAGAFTAGKTFVLLGWTQDAGTQVTGYREDADVIYVQTSDTDGSGSDDYLDDTAIEIRVYP